MSSDERIAEFRKEYLYSAARQFDGALSRVSSPIERIMLAYLLCRGFEGQSIGEYFEMRDVVSRMGIVKSGSHMRVDDVLWEVIVQPQIQFDGFVITPDFGLLETSVPEGVDPAAVAVELDGHDFHERTKEQATRDKKRDRLLASKGWSVIRFTGSEVVRDPDAVYDDWHTAIATECKKRGRPIE